MTAIPATAIPDTDTDMVAVDLFDVAELAVTCAFVRDWIEGAPPAVTASLARFGGTDIQVVLLEALGRLADTLAQAVPWRRPDLPAVAAPLGRGETLGLAELLADLAVGRWPAEPGPAAALAEDCRRWASRLTRTPGVTP